MPKPKLTPKTRPSDKAIAAWKKNLSKWETKHALDNMGKDNWFVITIGLFLGFVLGVMSNIGKF